MKYAFTLALLAALRQSHALTRPRQASLLTIPQEPTEETDASFGLLVDREGNLYYQASPSQLQTVDPTASSLTSIVTGLRGGDLGSVAVDNEGCLYTPLSVRRSATAKRADAKPASPTETLRGGSHEINQFGRLCVDDDGNFYSAPGSAAHGALESLRGGALEVDNEGNFYTPRAPAPSPHESAPLSLASNRRGHKKEGEDGILLARNKVRRKKSSTEDKPKEAAPQTTNAFIGFHNALMET